MKSKAVIFWWLFLILVTLICFPYFLVIGFDLSEEAGLLELLNNCLLLFLYPLTGLSVLSLTTVTLQKRNINNQDKAKWKPTIYLIVISLVTLIITIAVWQNYTVH